MFVLILAHKESVQVSKLRLYALLQRHQVTQQRTHSIALAIPTVHHTHILAVVDYFTFHQIQSTNDTAVVYCDSGFYLTGNTQCIVTNSSVFFTVLFTVGLGCDFFVCGYGTDFVTVFVCGKFIGLVVSSLLQVLCNHCH